MAARRVRSSRIRFLIMLLIAVVCAQAGVGPTSPAVSVLGSTGKIAGKVTNKSTKEPLVSVNVIIDGTVMGATTDIDGDFVIPNIPSGTYMVKARLVGFRQVATTGVRVADDATTELNFQMEETTVEVDQVVISAVRPLVQKDNTASRTLLEAEEITSRPVSTVAQVITSLPSINYENGQMLIRGRPLSEVAVLVDGVRTRNPLTQASFLNNISLSAIDELIVLTGSFDAEYGEAQSGVFKITTKEGADKYHYYLETRYTPPGIKHWGPSLYDLNTPLYWENTHARHPQWWIDYPDQWTDPTGKLGSDPKCVWTPEQAYQNYLDTHKPLTDYANTPGYKVELTVGGPVPLLDGFHFFFSGNYESIAPLLGNSYLDQGTFLNATAKLSYVPGSGMKVLASASYNRSRTAWGITGPYSIYSLDSRYAYYDFDGLPRFEYNSEVLKFTHAITSVTMYEVQFTRSHTIDAVGPFPDDPLGWSASGPRRDNILAVDANGNPIIGAYQSIIGFNTLGYYSRHNDSNIEYKLSGFLSSQVSKTWEIKSGFEGTLFHLNHYNHAKSPERTDQNIYRPYQGAVYASNKLEFGGMIVNAGLRFDFYNPNNTAYLDLFSPLAGGIEPTKTYSQLSPRLGIAHPIDDKTVLHFSYGHFFQAPPFGDYGELYSTYGSLTTMTEDATGLPTAVGNRNLRPQKTVAYEVGLERNFLDEFVLQVTAYYKDITNTIRTVAVQTTQGLYRTSGNADYADARGVEFSLRKLPSSFYWGYINFTIRTGIDGKSGAPSTIRPDGTSIPETGDNIQYFNDMLKAGLMLQSPRDWGVLGGTLDDILLSFEYQAVFPNIHIQSDVFVSNGKSYLRPIDQNIDMRATKRISLFQNTLTIAAYVEVRNLLNMKHTNLGLFGTASSVDKEKFVSSDFKDVPATDVYGVPYLDMAKYRNLPRAVVFGASVEF